MNIYKPKIQLGNEWSNFILVPDLGKSGGYRKRLKSIFACFLKDSKRSLINNITFEMSFSLM